MTRVLIKECKFDGYNGSTNTSNYTVDTIGIAELETFQVVLSTRVDPVDRCGVSRTVIDTAETLRVTDINGKLYVVEKLSGAGCDDIQAGRDGCTHVVSVDAADGIKFFPPTGQRFLTIPLTKDYRKV